MYLKSLELHGFKSFPDKVSISFERGLTSIVGPNGSGKSNIADAIRWVLGEQSVKTLRGGKMEDVIFNGTENSRRPVGYAEVSITFDNSEGLLASEYSEVTVTRRLYRSGESEYLINRNAVRLKDINELFMDTGVGRDGYSIIGQGRIAEILSTKSEDRRQIFEEAAGISKFRYRKSEAQHKLEAAEENFVRISDILSELSVRVEPLRIESEKALKYLDLREEKKRLEVNLWIRELDKLKEQLSKAQEDYTAAKSQLDTLTLSVEQGESSLDRLYGMSQEKSMLVDQLRDSIKEDNERLASLQSSFAVRLSEIERSTADKSKLEAQIGTVNDKIADIDLKTAGQSGFLTEKKALLDEKQAGLASLQFEWSEVSGKLTSLSDEITSLEAAIEKKAGTLTDLKVNISAKHTHVENIRQRLNGFSETKGEKEKGLTEAISKLEEMQKEQKRLSELADSQGNILLGYELKIKSKEEKLIAAKEKADRIRAEKAGKDQRIMALEDMQKHFEGFNQSVKEVMKAFERGMLKNIHGPVSKLIKVPSEYTLALETALGQSSQNIVVNSEEDAKAAINFLKNAQAGRATFLPLTSVDGSELDARGIEKSRGYVGIASHLVSFDTKYAPIIRNMLGRTAVVEDIDCAIAMAKTFGYKFRIITLDGQVVNAGGAMTGGSSVKGIGYISRDNEIAALKAESASIEEKYQVLTRDIKAAQDEFNKLKADYEAEKESSTKKGMSLLETEGQIKHLTYIADTLKTELSEIDTEIEESQKSLTTANESIAVIEARLSAEQAKLDELNDKKRISSEKSAELTAKSDSLKEDISSQKLQILEAQNAYDTINSAIIALDSQKNEFESEKAECERAIAELEENYKKLSDLQSSEQSEISAIKEAAQSKEAQIGEISADRDKMDKEVNEIRQQTRNLTSQKENMVREVTRLESKMLSVQNDYDGTASKLWEEYQLTYTAAKELYTEISSISATQKRINEIKNAIKDLGDVNVNAIEEYKSVKERYEFLNGQVQDIQDSKDQLNKIIDDLTHRMKEIFEEQFASINQNFAECFKELFGGGTAKLTMTEPSDVLSSDIEINVQPPGKIIKNLSALSGGEQAFVAIALYFAILRVRPTPFCVLDEIEAALDEVNVARFAAYLKRYSDKTQFVVITHRRGTMEAADILYGVTMQEHGVSKLLSINVKEAARAAGIQ